MISRNNRTTSSSRNAPSARATALRSSAIRSKATRSATPAAWAARPQLHHRFRGGQFRRGSRGQRLRLGCVNRLGFGHIDRFGFRFRFRLGRAGEGAQARFHVLRRDRKAEGAFLRDRRMLSVNLEKSCRARDFYSGFYVEKNKDGQLCISRDKLQSRTGARCEIETMRQLVEVRS